MATLPIVHDPRIPVQVHKLIDLAKAIQHCKTPEDRATLHTVHQKLSAERRENEEALEICLAPILKRERETRAPYKLVIETCALWIQFCKQRMQAYDAEVNRLARLKQEEENRKAAERNRQITQKAEASGTEPILVAPKIVEIVPKTMRSEEGTTTRKTVKRWRFKGQGPDEDCEKWVGNDPRLAGLSKDNMLVNVKRINQLVKLGGNEKELEAQGIEVYEEYDYAARGGRS